MYRLLSFLLLFANITTHAQTGVTETLAVESFEITNDISATKFPRHDKQNKIAALIKIMVVDKVVKVEGDIIANNDGGLFDDKGMEKWVYMPAGSRSLKVYTSKYGKTEVDFSQYGVDQVASSSTYYLTLTVKKSLKTASGAPQGSVNFGFQPVGSIILMDGIELGTTPLIVTGVKEGEHQVEIRKSGYESMKKQIVVSNGQTTHVRGMLHKPETSLGSDPVKTFTVNGVSFRMLLVKGGTFQMGADDQDTDAKENERPAHKVKVSSFYLSETEVTQELWHAVMGGTCAPADARRPAVVSNSEQASEFLYALRTKTDMKLKFNLPTEAQWEYAARGGRQSKNYKYSGSNQADDVAWSSENSGGATHDVATKRLNELGFYDMSGNVSEVVQDDWYNYTVQPRVNPNLWQGQWDNVARGGDYRSLAAEVRVTQRQKHSNAPAIGFRIMIQ